MDTTYRVGRITPGRCFGPVSPNGSEAAPRPLIRESDDLVVAIVDSDSGPAVLGSMSASQVWARFRLPAATLERADYRTAAAVEEA